MFGITHELHGHITGAIEATNNLAKAITNLADATFVQTEAINRQTELLSRVNVLRDKSHPGGW